MLNTADHFDAMNTQIVDDTMLNTADHFDAMNTQIVDDRNTIIAMFLR